MEPSGIEPLTQSVRFADARQSASRGARRVCWNVGWCLVEPSGIEPLTQSVRLADARQSASRGA